MCIVGCLSSLLTDWEGVKETVDAVSASATLIHAEVTCLAVVTSVREGTHTRGGAIVAPAPIKTVHLFTQKFIDASTVTTCYLRHTRSTVGTADSVATIDDVATRSRPAAVCARASWLVEIVQDASRVGRALEVGARVD